MRLTLQLTTGNWGNKHTHPPLQYIFYKCLGVTIVDKVCQNHNNLGHSPCHQTLLYLAQMWDLAYHSCKNTLFIYTSSKKKKILLKTFQYTVKYNSRIETVCRDRRSDAGDILQGSWGMLTHNSHSFLCSQLWSKHLGPICVHTSEETVHALHCLAAIVHAFRSDALAAGVVKPAVLGSSHRLAVQFALTDGHAVIKVDHRAHVFWKETNQK